MIELTAAEVAQAVSGRLRGVPDADQLRLTHADTDSRAMRPSALFIAKPGEVTDGHHFIDDALSAGAVLALAERETADPSGNPHPAVLVDDVVQAMGMLAREIVVRIRRHSATTVIGVTGSAGKTTTKDLLAALLVPQGQTVAPQGSYNGEVGVPLTVFTAELETRYLIIEMGADAPGNIRALCDMVEPDIGVVLMVGTAHAGKFGGADKIAQTKGELAELATDHVILNTDDAQVSAMADRASAPVTWFGADCAPGACTVTAEDVRQRPDGRMELTLSFAQAGAGAPISFRITSGLIGSHHVTNLLAAAAAAYRAGVQPADIAARLDGVGPSSRWRMERTEITWAGQAEAVTILNDAYNANPESMREALRTLTILSRDNQRRGVAVLGAMFELGDESIWLHHQVGETVVRLNIDLTLVVGDEAYALYRGAVAEGSWGAEVQWVASPDEAEAWLRAALQPGDIVLFKSSNSAGLRLLGDKFAAEGRN